MLPDTDLGFIDISVGIVWQQQQKKKSEAIR